MSDIGARQVEITLLTGSLGPHLGAPVVISLPDGADSPPEVIVNPAPHFPGAWRRTSTGSGGSTYVRLPRIAAP